MKQIFFGIVLLCFPFYIIAQESQNSDTVDARYFEDQFYAGVTYNLY